MGGHEMHDASHLVEQYIAERKDSVRNVEADRPTSSPAACRYLRFRATITAPTRSGAFCAHIRDWITVGRSGTCVGCQSVRWL